MMNRFVLLCALTCTGFASARVKTGLDVLVEQDFAPLAGKRVSVVANQNTLTWDHRSIIDVMAKSAKIKLVAVFAPEHGFSSMQQAGAEVESAKDTHTGVPIYSLYHRGSYRPTDEILKGIDAIVYDLRDVGARFYTYTTQLGYIMEAAAKHNLPVWVLDRPNPINGVDVQGPMLDDKYRSMIGYGKRPVRHGMTLGELAQFFNGEYRIGADVHVVKMEGWTRRMWMDETGLEWVNPSPNLRNLTAVIAYPGTCLVETTMFSIGRGTDTPFLMLGAPWLNALEVADYLNARGIPGVRVIARRFTPTEPPFKGQECKGLDVQVLNRDQLNSPLFGLELIAALLKFHPDKFSIDKKMMLLLGNDRVADFLKQGLTGTEVNTRLEGEIETFKKVREKYLLY
jgi:uncharacterized protein YbbC (DUF1343 family)